MLPDGRDLPRYTVQVRVNIRDNYYGSSGLQLEQDLPFDAADFLAISAILGRFHELAEAIKSEQTRGQEVPV